jgi:hypothetical protein
MAFAGFASLIAIIGMRTSLGTPGFDLLRYWVMLELSLAALALSLLPPVLILLGVTAPGCGARSAALWPSLPSRTTQ